MSDLEAGIGDEDLVEAVDEGEELFFGDGGWKVGEGWSVASREWGE